MLLTCVHNFEGYLSGCGFLLAVDGYHDTLPAVSRLKQNSSLGWGRIAGLQGTPWFLPRAASKPWGCEALGEVQARAPRKLRGLPLKFGVFAAWRRERPRGLEG